jgi:EpsI family protein
MVPLPEVSIAQLNFKLKIMSSDWGVALANLIGIVVERSSNQVFLPGDKSLIIANVCNGLRTLISVIAFGAIYAYICRLNGFWRIFLFAMSVPVAVISNAVRIVSLIVVANFWSVKAATGWFHDFSGFMILVISFLLLFSLERLILWGYKLIGKSIEITPLFHKVRKTPNDQDQGKRLVVDAVRGRNGWISAILLIILAGGTWWMNQSTPSLYSENTIKDILPAQVRINDEEWNSYVIDFDTNVLLVLETEAAFLRRYVRPGGKLVDFCIVFSKDNRKGTHPPDLCLEGTGQNIITKNGIQVKDITGIDVLSCRELVVDTGGRQTYFIYTYKCGDLYTGSFWLQQFMIFVNGLLDRNASGALIRISTPIETGIDDARTNAIEFLRMGIPRLDQELP